ncbi:biotin/lipoyl-binding protein, partial [Bradyrhizobium sp. 31Argb]|uniref:biotin/lipoyl-binding protein n=1 Tax=Bradyrhizobium sp. 31Argb TaxID=3141247 RepID=UPI0037489FE7
MRLPPAILPKRETGVVITAIDEFERRQFPWCAEPTQASPRYRLGRVTLAGNLLVVGFVLGLGIWSAFAPLESAAIASGVVESESSRKTIQHLEGGIIRKILVADGDAVSAGQTLIALEDTRARAEVQSLQGQLWDAAAREARLLAEQQGQELISFPVWLDRIRSTSGSVDSVLTAQQNIFETRRQVFQSQATILREKRLQVAKEIEGLKAQEDAVAQRAAIVREELDMVTILVNKGLERRPRLLNLERELADIEGRRAHCLTKDVTGELTVRIGAAIPNRIGV